MKKTPIQKHIDKMSKRDWQEITQSDIAHEIAKWVAENFIFELKGGRNDIFLELVNNYIKDRSKELGINI